MSTLQAGTILEGRYQVQSQGPEQDLGALYYAHDTQTGHAVDLLVLPLQAPLGDSIVEDVIRVQRAVGSLDQPGLVPYERVGWTNGLLYLARRHVAGHSLARLLAHSGALKPHAAVEIAIHLCEYLAAAHRAGLVHGSLAPDSLFLGEGSDADEEGLAVTITDLGLLPALRPALAAPGRPWGRRPYLSPEQAAGERVQPSSDVYVIGCLIYLMLTGRPPFRADDEVVLAVQHLRQQPPSLQILVPELPGQLVQIVQKALAKEPAARYRNAGQLAHILRGQLRRQPKVRASQPAAGPVGVPAQVAEPLASPGRPAAAMPAPGGQRLVVPPPPRRQPVYREYEFVEDEEWIEEPEGIDWRMLGLLVVALIAVLGLIPLWRTLYRRYSALPPLSAPGSVVPLPQEMALRGTVCWGRPLSPEEATQRELRGCAYMPKGGALCNDLCGVPSSGERRGWTRNDSLTMAVPLPGPELVDWGFFWYNGRSADVSVVGTQHRPTWAGSLGVELTGQLEELL